MAAHLSYQHLAHQTTSEMADTLLSEYQHYNELLLELLADCDEDCPPPLFDLPPPPPPPWLDMPPLCDNCEDMPGVTRTNNVQDIFKNVVIITCGRNVTMENLSKILEETKNMKIK